MTAVRRCATVPLLLALIPVVAALFVVSAVLGGVVALVTGGPGRPARITGFTLLYLLADLAGLCAAAALWVRCPSVRRPGAGQARTAASYALLRRLLTVLRAAAGPVFRLDVRISPPIRRQDTPPEVPLLVFVRHAGPGDSFLLLHVLLAEAGLRPHTVLKGALRADPALDVLLGRVPHVFLPPPQGTGPEAVGAAAAGLGPGDALVLFPEGGNFTPRRSRRALSALLRRGRYRHAARAARLGRVLPPREGGVLAALDAAPTADVVFVAHCGLDVIDSVHSAWASLPLRQPVRAHWWRVPAAAVPAGAEARADWLLAQWTRVDEWVAAHAAAGTAHV